MKVLEKSKIKDKKDIERISREKQHVIDIIEQDHENVESNPLENLRDNLMKRQWQSLGRTHNE